ncbi:unnamed protein product [Paramecium pentaurelia]|uniref:4-alpha-hydroxy-tetrahydropterin dehydratase n=1 Tax=Paramecium pentaurelia TaxID=43138 RepID=A0A8S1W032_9CILI|nr:unnamed protein product [Paramecium pentaurelia]
MYRYLSNEIGFKTTTTTLISSLKIVVRDLTDIPTISVSKLNQDEVSHAIDVHQLTWSQNIDTSKLIREYKFNSFKETFVFMGSVSQIADQMKHFPKWTQKGSVLKVEMTTPDCQGITIKDLFLAYTMDKIANNIQSQPVENVCDIIKIQSNHLLNTWNSNYNRQEEVKTQEFQKNILQL